MNIYYGTKTEIKWYKTIKLSRNFYFIKIINILKIFLQGQEKKQKGTIRNRNLSPEATKIAVLSASWLWVSLI
ncbi:hypothetical protein OIU79_015350 [Salix purpurea]|uniref:Uncharacterized protein n=1 Tax=Salix purpurea TaxID=77065 RepID=A0A9Q0PC32_SALPP|nr:hypothetical protein OIU79_015350 [Salix purpurea]